MSLCVTTSLVLIPTYTQECVSATGLTDMPPTDEKLADIRECPQRVGTTFSTRRQQTKMSVVWRVEPTDTFADIASQVYSYYQQPSFWKLPRILVTSCGANNGILLLLRLKTHPRWPPLHCQTHKRCFTILIFICCRCAHG